MGQSTLFFMSLCFVGVRCVAAKLLCAANLLAASFPEVKFIDKRKIRHFMNSILLTSANRIIL